MMFTFENSAKTKVEEADGHFVSLPCSFAVGCGFKSAGKKTMVLHLSLELSSGDRILCI